MSNLDDRFMQRALELAAQAYGCTSPNPLVGAVVSRGDVVVGEAFHARAGSPHAEPLAIAAARAAAGLDGGPLTLHVNLEPCAHHGRTPPCVDAILAAPIGRVVAALIDPNPLVGGKGIARLRAAGLRVDVGWRASAAAELNHMFIARQMRQRPFVALKVALSADDCIAAADGQPAAITGAAANAHAHRLRAGHDAILVGVETVRHDRPRLDRRLYAGPGTTPRRLVLDPQLRCEPQVWQPGPPPPVLLCSVEAADRVTRSGERAAFEQHVRLWPLPVWRGRFEPDVLMAAFGALEAWSVLVEGGGETHRGFLETHLWDRVYVYRNPSLRLNGLHWQARPAWETRRERATETRTALGGDELHVFTHTDSLPPLG